MAKAIYLITRLLNEDVTESDPNTNAESTTESSKEDSDYSPPTHQNDASECKNGHKGGENSEDAPKQKDQDSDESTEYLKIALKGLVGSRSI